MFKIFKLTAIGSCLVSFSFLLYAANSDVQKGYSLASQGDAKGAIAAFRRAEKQDPNNIDVQYSLGVLLGCGDGIEHYKNAVKIDPSHSEANYNLGLCYHQNNQLKLAEEKYRAAMRRAKNKAVVLDSVAFVLSDQGRKKEALKIYKTAVNEDPRDPIIRYNRGNVYAEVGQIGKALKEYEKALELNPQYYNAALNIAETHGSQSNYDAQLKYLQKAIEIDPLNPAAYINHALPLLEKNKKAEAFQHLAKGAQLAFDQQNNQLLRAAYSSLKSEFPNEEFTKKLESVLQK